MRRSAATDYKYRPVCVIERPQVRDAIGGTYVGGEVMNQHADIIRAIESELHDTRRPRKFKIQDSRREGALWICVIDLPDTSTGNLDDTLEGCTATWDGGSAEILTVLSEQDSLVLRFASSPPPEAGGTIRIFQPRYLSALQQAWRDED